MSVIVNGPTGAGGVSDVGDLTTTGLTPGNYVRVENPSGLEQRTPAQVLNDIGAEAAGAAATKLPISGGTGVTFAQPSAADFTFMTIDPADADALPFYWKLWTATQTGRDNVGWNLGYNQAAGGGPQSNTDATFYLQMETHYLTADPIFEFHLNAYTADGLSSTRPFHINVYKDDLYTEHSYFFDKLNWLTRNGTIQLMSVMSGATAALSQWIMYMPPFIRVDGTSALVIQNASAATRVILGNNGGDNGGYFKLAGINPTLDGDTTRYLQVTNFAGISWPGSLGTFYASGTWDTAPTINLASGKTYKVNGSQVVGARIIDARCDDTIDSGDATTDGVIDALRDAMIAHGLIAAA